MTKMFRDKFKSINAMKKKHQIDLTLFILTLIQKKIREVIKEYFEKKLPDATKYRKSEQNIMLLYLKRKKLSLTETSAVRLNREVLAFRGHKLLRFTFPSGFQNFKEEENI